MKKKKVEIDIKVTATCGCCGKRIKLKKDWDRLGRKPMSVPNQIHISGECKCGFDISYCLELDCFGYPE